MPVGIAGDKLLQRAKDRLDAFAFVGLVERFPEMLAALSHTFGWVMPTEYRDLNVSPQRLRREAVSACAMELILEYTRLDSDLYQYARGLFESRLNSILTE
jgi:hypothetical protein